MEARERIVGEALRLFADRGYDGIGVQEIVDAADVTKPTLYHHFVNKRGLLLDVCARIETAITDSTTVVEAYAGDLPKTLQETIANYFAFAARHPRELRLLVALLHAPPGSEARDVARPLELSLDRRFARLFKRAAVDHGNMRGHHKELAQSFMAILNWYAIQIADGEIEPSDELAFRVMHRFSHGIYS